MLKALFPINFNPNCFSRKIKNNDVVEKKYKSNIYKKLLDKNRNTYLNIAKDNITWFNKKMEKTYPSNDLTSSKCESFSISEVSIHYSEEIDTPNKDKTVSNEKHDMKYGPVFLQYTLASVYGTTLVSIMMSIGVIYYLLR